MASQHRSAMTECPACGEVTDEVLECSECGAEGCKSPDCIMRAGRSKPCTDCRGRKASEDLDDSGAEEALSDEDVDDD